MKAKCLWPWFEGMFGDKHVSMKIFVSQSRWFFTHLKKQEVGEIFDVHGPQLSARLINEKKLLPIEIRRLIRSHALQSTLA